MPPVNTSARLTFSPATASQFEPLHSNRPGAPFKGTRAHMRRHRYSSGEREYDGAKWTKIMAALHMRIVLDFGIQGFKTHRNNNAASTCLSKKKMERSTFTLRLIEALSQGLSTFTHVGGRFEHDSSFDGLQRISEILLRQA